MKKLQSYADMKARRNATGRRGGATKRYRTRGGRNSNPGKLAWLRTWCSCLVASVGAGTMREFGHVAPAFVVGCAGPIEVHHHRKRGARASDDRTLPLCRAHHRTGPRSVEKLGRIGFESYVGVDLDSECVHYEALYRATQDPLSPE
jgi:hypothetical protein